MASQKETLSYETFWKDLAKILAAAFWTACKWSKHIFAEAWKDGVIYKHELTFPFPLETQ